MTEDVRREPSRARHEQWGPRISVLVGLLFACLFVFSGPGVDEFCLDDAWIHLAYAKSLRLGDGLSYNPGDWETGFSSPLWVLLLAAWPTGPEPVVSVKLLGALLHAGTAGLAAAIALDLASARASVERPLPVLSISLLAGCLCATAPTLLQAASSGMEVPLATCVLLACLRASLREQWLLAGVLGFAAALARPELLACLLGFVIVAGIGRMLCAVPRPRSSSLLASASPLLGAGAGLLAWIVYCWLVSGWPWPNTAYVKVGVASPSAGLEYLTSQVLPWQPWFAGLGGLALIVAALWTELSGRGVLESPATGSGTGTGTGASSTDAQTTRHWQLSALFSAWLVGMLATALSRPLDPEILFYQSRYFAVFAAIPPIVIALGVARTHRVLSLVLILPIALLTGLQITAANELARAQERGVALLHGDPARYVTRELSPDAVIAVEGAGAMRYRTPRSMTIVDIIGLNDADIAHAPDDSSKACVLVQRAPDHMVLPDHIAASLAKVFDFRVVTRFTDPAWAQIEQPRAVEVLLLEVVSTRPPWRERCATD
jgi:hypothetical protein